MVLSPVFISMFSERHRIRCVLRSFGVLGRPLREFSRAPLMPVVGSWRAGAEGEEQEEGGGGEVAGVRGSKGSAGAGAAGRHSRAQTGVSRATTEAPLSDAE